jgi:hypothetical protein
MGMPKDPYPLLYNLQSPERQFYEEALAAVAPFRLFAFIIPSSERGDGFLESVGKRFIDLSESTTDKLLFFSPVASPASATALAILTE